MFETIRAMLFGSDIPFPSEKEIIAEAKIRFRKLAKDNYEAIMQSYENNTTEIIPGIETTLQDTEEYREFYNRGKEAIKNGGTPEQLFKNNQFEALARKLFTQTEYVNNLAMVNIADLTYKEREAAYLNMAKARFKLAQLENEYQSMLRNA